MAAATQTGTLSYAQLKAVWLDAAKGTQYATNAWASLMAAIAEAESGGDPDITNPTDNGGKQTSWGLWQISLGNHAAPAANWNDPSENAQLALGKLQGQGLSAWGTYTSGAYKAYLSDKTTADTTGIPAGASAAVTSQLTAQTEAASNCLFGIHSITVPVVPGLYHQTITPGFCILTKPDARAITGALFLIAGGAILLMAAGQIGAQSRTVQQTAAAVTSSAPAKAPAKAAAAAAS
jgi:Lysozyme like domain